MRLVPVFDPAIKDVPYALFSESLAVSEYQGAALEVSKE